MPIVQQVCRKQSAVSFKVVDDTSGCIKIDKASDGQKLLSLQIIKERVCAEPALPGCWSANSYFLHFMRNIQHRPLH